MHKHIKKTLQLRSQTIRALAGTELAGIAGGVSGQQYTRCNFTQDTCNNTGLQYGCQGTTQYPTLGCGF